MIIVFDTFRQNACLNIFSLNKTQENENYKIEQVVDMYYHIYLMIKINYFSSMNFLKSSYTINVYVARHVTQIIISCFYNTY